jgi:hypothetical protein
VSVVARERERERERERRERERERGDLLVGEEFELWDSFVPEMENRLGTAL